MNIPKIIHQSWKDENVTPEFEYFTNTWKLNHPDWQYNLWTDEMNRDFIKENYPDFLLKYDSYPYHIQRVDAVRYFILFKMGGVYVDLDFECIKDIEPLLCNGNNVFGCEPREHCILHKKNMIISNAFMACISGSLFFKELCNELYSNSTVTGHRNNDILETTGPFMLTRTYESYCRKNEIVILLDKLIYPLTKNELERSSSIRVAKTKGAFAIHHYYGTWWREQKL